MSAKERLDVLLVEQGLYESREKAKAAVMAGLVSVDGERVDKAGTKIKVEATITVKGELHPYVSRGGLKLEKAIATFGESLVDKVVMDVGASTGGFTDCALQNGAKQVYSIDVGYGQLAWKLRNDPRVVVMERTNFRHLKREDLKGETPQVAVMDVSFISIRLLLPVISSLLSEDGVLLTLIKPQFEAGRERVGKNGIVRDPEVHRDVLVHVLGSAVNQGFQVQEVTYSPITGGDGNIEFLAHLTKQGTGLNADEIPVKIDAVVQAAHASLER
ncbi:TlyA family RNA methyltransferase [Tumebacillus permanentifrigoris]|uniref:23S rRNA (Cytidine1920-2'-O)/16S rRNA (Cytidine1409-2'-O)-methyltransferase n=1 Tax=Tumebacillus permanentifrigoris TaxID=378543 RepID=A0A316DU45_9BACL|nr:TlyA family RNA methyltransferase [Tumebacillus permanentifrigoris]PWK11543.1 23S rRNA (cytidine1920-2'-O)/16S rRNA (cytidine1409-2'-O)-methyltransferase [Tumebacillus permanentifrigoris]